MNLIDNFIIIFLVITGIMYFIGLTFFSFKNPFSVNISKNNSPNSKTYGISVIIPFRNEEKSLKELIKCIENLQYPDFEVIFIDDASSDKSKSIIDNFIENNKNIIVKYIKNETHEGKKISLLKGFSKAEKEIIVTTDADCILEKEWLYAINNIFNSENCDLLIGQVRQTGKCNFINAEFLALQAVGFLLAQNNNPVFCSGANLAFRKNLIQNLTNNEYRPDIISGDDIFLLSYALKIKAKISISLENASFVTTSPPADILTFIKQRLRWASKTKYVRNSTLKILALSVFTEYFLYFIALYRSLYSENLINIFLIVYFLKILSDFVMLEKASQTWKMKINFPCIFLSEIILPFYIIFTGLLSLVIKPNWKK